MLRITKNKIFQYQSLLKTSPNLEEIKDIPKNKKSMSAVPKNFLENQICVITRVLKRNYLIITLLRSFILKKEMLLKYLLLNVNLHYTITLCSSSYPKKGTVTRFPLIVSTCRSTCFLNMKKNSEIQTRSMMSQRVVARAINSLHNVPRTNIAPYATHRVCDAEKAPMDPQALKNNPTISIKNKTFRHPEIRREECSDDTECKEKACTTLCSPAKGPEKATGHLTHGTPQNPYAKTVEKLDSVDAKGQPKDQNSVIYKNAHDVASPGIENVQATSYINQPHILNKIKKHEDKS
jgi:hypothetical protein